jgi:hypothetical protein
LNPGIRPKLDLSVATEAMVAAYPIFFKNEVAGVRTYWADRMKWQEPDRDDTANR